MELSFHTQHDHSAAEPFEIGEVQWLRRPGDANNQQLSAGIWHITPEQAPDPFDLSITAHETIYIASGHLRIETEGQVLDLPTGAMASFSPGAQTRWTVLEPTIEFFVYS